VASAADVIVGLSGALKAALMIIASIRWLSIQ